MRFLIACVVALAAGQTALAKSLPDAEYVLSGALTPAIQNGYIVPVFVHLKTGGDRMDWTFVTAYSPDKLSCETYGKCQRRVQSLSHIVDWSEDGTIRVVEEIRAKGDGTVIDRQDMDDSQIYPAISALVAGGTLVLDETGGIFTRKTRRSKHEVTLYRGDLEFLDQVLMVGIGFEQSIARLNHCELHQLARIRASDARTPAEAETLAALGYTLMQWTLQNEQQRIVDQTGDPQAEDARAMGLRLAFVRLASAIPMRALVEAAMDGTPLSDEDILDQAREAVEPLRERLGDDFAALETQVFETDRAALLAAMRYQARFVQKIQEGEDPIAAICADVTLGG